LLSQLGAESESDEGSPYEISSSRIDERSRSLLRYLLSHGALASDDDNLTLQEPKWILDTLLPKAESAPEKIQSPLKKDSTPPSLPIRPSPDLARDEARQAVLSRIFVGSPEFINTDPSSEIGPAREELRLQDILVGLSGSQRFKVVFKALVDVCDALVFAHRFGLLHEPIELGAISIFPPFNRFRPRFTPARSTVEIGVTSEGDMKRAAQKDLS